MSTVDKRTIKCDKPGCGRMFSAVGPKLTVRGEAIKYGWRRHRGQDYCHRHAVR